MTRTGQIVSPQVSRLGQGWTTGRHPEGSPGAGYRPRRGAHLAVDPCRAGERRGPGSLASPRARLRRRTHSHSFATLGDAIDDAFARWDRSHLQEFTLAGGQRIGDSDPDWDEPGEILDHRRVKLSRLQPGEQFVYVFDLGDDWAHLCTVAEVRIDPLEVLGIVPDRPLPYWGWGSIPDQYGRRWDGDDGESPMPRNPRTVDLPPLRYDWGPERLR